MTQPFGLAANEHGPGGESFVGRARELAELRRGIDQAIASRGSCILISGEPGIGKTRLAREVAVHAESRRMGIAWGRCWEGGGAPAYWPWLQIIRGCLSSIDLAQRRSLLESEAAPHIVQDIAQILPELRPMGEPRRPLPVAQLNGEQARFRMFESVTTLLEGFARSQPMLFVLDDLHDADQSSLMMLRFIARDVAEVPILIVGTYRDVEVRRSPALSKLIGDLNREARSIPLAGLSEAELAELVKGSWGRTPDRSLVSKLHAVTDGNPLFVDGIVRILIAEQNAQNEVSSAHHFRIPDSVRESIRQRLAALSDQGNLLLKIAAVVGNEFEASLCEAASNLSRDELNRLLDEASIAGIVTPLAHDRYRFAHALIRGAVYDALDTNTRHRLHGEIGKALEEIYAKDLQPHLAELAHHFREAGVVEKAIDYSILAGEEAFAGLAFEEAVLHWEAAMNLMESRGEAPQRRADLAVRLSDAWFRIDLAQMIARLEQAVRLFERAGKPAAAAAVRASLALQYAKPDDETITDIALAREHLRRVEQAVVEEPGTSPVLYYFLAKTLAAVTSLHRDEGITAAQRCMELSDRVGDRESSIDCAGLLSRHLLFCGRTKEALALLDRARESADEFGQAIPRLRAAENRGYVLLRLWDSQTAQTWIREFPGFRVAESPFHSRVLAQELCAALLLAGELGEAASLIGRAQKSILDGMLAFRLGDWERAEAVWIEGLDRCRKAGARGPACDYIASLAALHLARGQQAQAAALLLQILEISLDAPQVQLELQTRASLMSLYAEMACLEQAQPHVARCREILSEGEDWRGLTGHVARAEAVVAAADGRLDEPEEHFCKADQIFQYYHLPWEEAENCLYWGLALKATGDSRANEKFGAAIAIYRRHGAGQRWIDRVEAAREQSAHGSKQHPVAWRGQAAFLKEGEFWTIAYGGKTLRLKDAKGLGYLAYLLAHPGERIHVHDLVLVIEGSAARTAGSGASAKSVGAVSESNLNIVRELGDAGAALDGRARTEYRDTLRELRAELEQAEDFNDSGRAEHIRREIDAIERELSSSAAIGGRDRVSAAHIERARSMVSKRIRATLAKIGDKDRSLASHFAASIKTGYFCAYLPEPDSKISWQL